MLQQTRIIPIIFVMVSAASVAALFVALVVIGEAITLTFTRAGLITMAASLALVGAIRAARAGAPTAARC